MSKSGDHRRRGPVMLDSAAVPAPPLLRCATRQVRPLASAWGKNVFPDRADIYSLLRRHGASPVNPPLTVLPCG